MRTNSEWKRFVNRIENSENLTSIYGIKGTSPLLDLTYIDMTIFCPPEFMHSQLLGTTKLFVDSWLGKIKGNIKLNNQQIETINMGFNQIKFPSKILRRLNPIDHKLKATDYENILYYGLIMLYGVIPKAEFEIFALFSNIISNLTKSIIEEEEIKKCELFIDKFMNEFNKLYPTDMFRYNVHVIHHLPEVVRLYGPLLVNSAFHIENSMGVMGKKVKSFHKVSEQVMKKALMQLSIHAAIQSNRQNNSAEFIDLLKNNYSNFIFNLPISPTIKCSRKNGKISELKTEKFRILTNNYNNQHHQHRNQYVQTKCGRYIMVTDIIEQASQFIIIGNEFINVKNWDIIPDFQFCHIKTGELSLNKIEIGLSCIDKPFTCCFQPRLGLFFIFDLFNRHL
uniref:Uncharacterized protein LOC113794021 n=1 Tax=Dermatophagoides pteronyssinus TaxID=6956 RepID=A0A6P6Y5Z7_DERPT|nr:uncharacterized protein LOC113794021 [Dermatophagoides pteronyssinus]